MSLIIGIRSAEGVVLAASGADWMASLNGPPAARQLEKKLRPIGDGAVLGVVGHDGLAQEMAMALERYLRNPAEPTLGEAEIRGGVREALAAPIQRTVAIHRTLEGLPGFGTTSSGYVLSHSVVALPLNGSVRLFALDPECSMTEVTEETCFVAVGRGKLRAESFLRFLRSMLCPAELPDLKQAELAAFWALQHCIESAAGSPAAPVQVIVVRQASSGAIEVHERSERERGQLFEAMKDAEEAIRRSLRSSSGNSRPLRKRVPEVRFTLGLRDRQTTS